MWETVPYKSGTESGPVVIHKSLGLQVWRLRSYGPPASRRGVLIWFSSSVLNVSLAMSFVRFDFQVEVKGSFPHRV